MAQRLVHSAAHGREGRRLFEEAVHVHRHVGLANLRSLVQKLKKKVFQFRVTSSSTSIPIILLLNVHIFVCSLSSWTVDIFRAVI